MAAPGEHIDLVCDARAGGVDQVEKWNPDAGGDLLAADDLFDGSSAPAARLDGWVVCHHGDLTAVDGAEPGDHAVGRQLLSEDVREQPVFHKRAWIQQEVQAFACGELVLLAQLGQVARTTLQRPVAKLSLPVFCHYLPLKSGSRFSRKARTPSLVSSV